MGICVSDVDISSVANVIGCGVAKFPLKYLGVPVGCNMAWCVNWESIVSKFSSKLSHWKTRLISVGGRHSLIKSVLNSLPTYFMSIYKVPVLICSKLESMRNKFFIGSEIGEKKMTWVSWNKCLASKISGGLGIGSILALNAGLLFKWIWRFKQKSDVDISSVANVIGCGVAKLPLKYLGVPVGCNMAWCINWESIVSKFSSKLSHWKTRLISVGGRHSLIKSVLNSLPTYFMSIYKVPVSICSKLESMRNKFFIGSEIGEKKMTWVSWNKCLASKISGGLGIGSILALNAGLLFKWIWRFNQKSTDLWVTVIKAIHGPNGGIHVDSMHSPIQGTWNGILSMIKSPKLKSIDLLSLCTRKVGNGASVRFWDDIWCGSQPLKCIFPRIHMLDNDKGCTL
ncbi:RNA-directed DNA polymerase, eukaryota [Artemisia annua]|uniref:RNA-directed DNA polymerase, eukaryota n=1 Tax=Artemisia annua TaxID=35608 RepID=A0A2U1Q0R4_ARTAN|nr:RNA-directed DNA polymerase, eukaryota [Artemisia annua]